MNILIGENNSGKSTVLRYLSEEFPFNEPNIEDRTRVHNGGVAGDTGAIFAIEKSEVVQRLRKRYHISPQQPELVEFIESLIDELSEGGLVWYEIKVRPRGENTSELINVDVNRFIERDDRFGNYARSWYNFWTAIQSARGGDFRAHWIPEVLSAVSSCLPSSFPRPFLIPAVRYIDEGGDQFTDFGGKKLIERLAELQNPDHYEREKLEVFERINNFVRSVVEKDDARIEVPSSRSHILVEMNSKVLPLSSLGTGIHQVIMMAAACTLNDGGIICIEEPELHLHPRLQRMFVNYLAQETSSQFFIATHSPVFIDAMDGSVFRVDNDGLESRFERVLTDRQRSELVGKLGVRASDILQSNYVVWVEGPSDRIYVRHWLHNFASDLREGVHYSIMFYGGKLLSHLSLSDEGVEAFIKLQKMARRYCVLLDGDLSSDQGALRPAKHRVVQEAEESGGFAWVTEGREIENYLTKDTVHFALSERYGSQISRFAPFGKFRNVLQFYRTKRDGSVVLEKNPDKVGIAEIASSRPADFSVFDLEEKVGRLVAAIREANEL